MKLAFSSAFFQIVHRFDCLHSRPWESPTNGQESYRPYDLRNQLRRNDTMRSARLFVIRLTKQHTPEVLKNSRLRDVSDEPSAMKSSTLEENSQSRILPRLRQSTNSSRLPGVVH